MKKLLGLLVVLTAVITQQLPAAEHTSKKQKLTLDRSDSLNTSNDQRSYTVEFKNGTTAQYPADVVKQLPMVQALQNIFKEGIIEDEDQRIYLRDCSKEEFDRLVPFLTNPDFIPTTDTQLLNALSAAHSLVGSRTPLYNRLSSLLLTEVQKYQNIYNHSQNAVDINNRKRLKLFKHLGNPHAQALLDEAKKKAPQSREEPNFPLWHTLRSLLHGPNNLETPQDVPVPNYTTGVPDITQLLLCPQDLIDTQHMPPLNDGKLNLSSQALTSLRGMPNFADLRELNLKYNSLYNLPEGAFANMPQLNSLNLSSNYIPALCAGVFKGLTNLKTLFLSHNHLRDVPTQALADIPQVQEVYLNRNLIKQVPAQAFPALPKLTTLSLGGNWIHSLDPAALNGLASLSELDLGGNQLTTITVGVFDTTRALQVLNLNSNEINTLPADALKGLGNLKKLDITLNKLSVVPTAALAHVSDLEKLCLGNNNITDIPARAFPLAKLKHLELQDQKTQKNEPARIHLNRTAFKGLPANCDIINPVPEDTRPRMPWSD